MSTFTICIMLGSAAVAGYIIGASTALWYVQHHEPTRQAAVDRQNRQLQAQVDWLRMRDRMRDALMWRVIGANFTQAIAVDYLKDDDE